VTGDLAQQQGSSSTAGGIELGQGFIGSSKRRLLAQQRRSASRLPLAPERAVDRLVLQQGWIESTSRSRPVGFGFKRLQQLQAFCQPQSGQRAH